MYKSINLLAIKQLSSLLIIFNLLVFNSIYGQDGALPKNWHQLDFKSDKYHGVSSEKALQILKNRKPKTIIVAVLDSGVEIDHEDLKENIWTNPGEIPNNGKDDDGNGYIDDVHGWNFLGNSKGENINSDNYEATRIYAKMRYKYDNADPTKLTKSQKKEYNEYLKLKEDTETKRQQAQTTLAEADLTKTMISKTFEALDKELNGKELDDETIEKLTQSNNEFLVAAGNIIKEVKLQVPNVKTSKEIQDLIFEDFDNSTKDMVADYQYHFNPDFDARKLIGDQNTDENFRYYGNNDVEGPDATHGTHVAGLIAASRKNNLGMQGVADHVKIMSVRCVPDGDEHDKDIANAIRYAVDNGASIINMSFGKAYSPQKHLIDEAVKYAESKDVLLVHAAGNGASDNDHNSNFPNRKFQKKKFFGKNLAKNWLEIGALSFQSAPNSIATFSNYGKKDVDLFSPGVAIYSTVTDNGYQNLQGTSMASPIAAGVAAIVRSYFPELTAKQVISVLKSSVSPIDEKVFRPQARDLVYMKELCNTGGVINAEKAVQLAIQTKGKKKIKSTDNNINPVKVEQDKIIKP